MSGCKASSVFIVLHLFVSSLERLTNVHQEKRGGETERCYDQKRLNFTETFKMCMDRALFSSSYVCKMS